MDTMSTMQTRRIQCPLDTMSKMETMRIQCPVDTMSTMETRRIQCPHIQCLKLRPGGYSDL